MTEIVNGNDRIRAILVLFATIGTIAFNWLAAAGYVGGVTPAEISDRYSTPVTPAGYAFAIWSLIYLGMIAFSIYQLLPSKSAELRSIRTLYIASALLNCLWIFFWHQARVGVCLAIIAGLLIVLFMINRRISQMGDAVSYWPVKAPFSIYFGWVTAATLVNFAIVLKASGTEFSDSTWTLIAIALVGIATICAVLIRYSLGNFLYPLAIAWALTAIGVKQSGQTAIVLATAVGTIICLIATLSFVLGLPSTDKPRV